jgi:hypothetical protein
MEGVAVAVVVVHPSTSPPVQYRGRTWIRVGPRRAVATPEEEARLHERRRHSALSFDARPLTGASIDDLDLDRFASKLLAQLVAADVVAENRRSVEHQLAGFGCDAYGHPAAHRRCRRAGLAGGAVVQFFRLEGYNLRLRTVFQWSWANGFSATVLTSAEQKERWRVGGQVFFVSQVGTKGSPERNRADEVHDGIVAPVAEKFQMTVIGPIVTLRLGR